MWQENKSKRCFLSVWLGRCIILLCFIFKNKKVMSMMIIPGCSYSWRRTNCSLPQVPKKIIQYKEYKTSECYAMVFWCTMRCHRTFTQWDVFFFKFPHGPHPFPAIQADDHLLLSLYYTVGGRDGGFAVDPFNRHPWSILLLNDHCCQFIVVSGGCLYSL